MMETFMIMVHKTHYSEGGYNLTWGGGDNPMNHEICRKKLSDTRTGGKNPAAKYNFTIKTKNGKIYNTDCIRQLCRETGFSRITLSRICDRKNYTPRNDFYKGWSVEKAKKIPPDIEPRGIQFIHIETKQDPL